MVSSYPKQCLVPALLCLLAVVDTVHACRCEQQSLAAYFQRAAVVFMGRPVPSAQPGQTDRDVRALQFQVVGRAFKGDPTSFRYRTGSSTASCGLDLSGPSRLHLVFGEIDPHQTGVANVSICNGTRSFDPSAPEGVEGFVDVPARQVLSALINLSRGEEPTGLPIGGEPGRDSLIGLVELPGVLNRDHQESQSPYRPLTLHSEPDPTSSSVASVAGESDILTRESGYEIAAAAVFESRDGWLRLRAADGRYGWLSPTEGSVFTPLEDLLIGRLGYLTADWDGRLWPSPGAGEPRRPVLPEVVRSEPPIEVLEAQWVATRLWLKIDLYQGNPCVGGESNPAEQGWIPAWNGSGQLTSWYWSRGC